MWRVTGWALRTWLKVTIGLGLGVLGVWLLADRFTAATAICAVLVEVWATGALAREWAYEARSSWWWPR